MAATELSLRSASSYRTTLFLSFQAAQDQHGSSKAG
jgi:hypothetical protein